jgi:hypothetical protein
MMVKEMYRGGGRAERRRREGARGGAGSRCTGARKRTRFVPRTTHHLRRPVTYDSCFTRHMVRLSLYLFLPLL